MLWQCRGNYHVCVKYEQKSACKNKKRLIKKVCYNNNCIIFNSIII